MRMSTRTQRGHGWVRGALTEVGERAPDSFGSCYCQTEQLASVVYAPAVGTPFSMDRLVDVLSRA